MSTEQAHVSEIISSSVTHITSIAGDTALLMDKAKDTVLLVNSLTQQINQLVETLRKA
ncbi:MAG: hypothetical protein LBD42_02060 [Desulfovibrio sp.]|jgi:methyl-accepting chemotaxis protein|nr:hypothetical protein [Desulfovibrio sp.]